MQLQSQNQAGEVTQLLRAARAGDAAAAQRIVPLVYDDMRRLARRQLGRELGARTLQATDLVHEAWLKLGDAGAAGDRAHFLALAAHAMRQVLVDRARARRAAKRGGGAALPVTLTDRVAVEAFDPAELLALDAALARLDDRQRRVVECRVFGGMEEKEIAEALGVTERTIRRDWAKARAWLVRWMSDPVPA